jgi:two-component system sensor histidine kinase BaeS
MMGDTAGSSAHEAQKPPGQDGATSQAGQLSQMSHMLSAISHEIKNPLASLKLNAQMVTRAIERGRAPRVESAALLTQAVDQLDHIASELSDAVRADSDRLGLTLKCVDLASIVARAAPEAAAIYHRVIGTEVVGAPLLAQADESRIRQVIAYLLANAAKYTPAQGSIALAARRAGGRIRVEARDQGPGIVAHELPYILDAFYRGAAAPQAHSAEGPGLGLSLYIARRIIERHGGAMGAESTPGAGATIWFSLPQTTCS